MDRYSRCAADWRLHRCEEDELHRRLITRDARGGDDGRSPEQKRLLVSLQAGWIGPTPCVCEVTGPTCDADVFSS